MHCYTLVKEQVVNSKITQIIDIIMNYLTFLWYDDLSIPTAGQVARRSTRIKTRVEPPNKGHFGGSHVVLFRDANCPLRGSKCTSPIVMVL